MTNGFASSQPGEKSRVARATRIADLPTTAALRLLDRLLAYPDSGTATLYGYAETERLAALSPSLREEVFVGTFDVTPRCVPYASIHLFGEENFKRGEFMAALRARYAEVGFETGGELPDHVGTLLRFAAAIGEEERADLCRHVLLGPLGRMSAALDAEHPYRPILEAAREVLLAAHPGVVAEPAWFERRPAHGAPGAFDRAAFTAGVGGSGSCGGCALAASPQPVAGVAPEEQ